MFIEESIIKLQKKCLSLEEKVKKLESRAKDMLEEVGYTIYTRNFLNFQVLANKYIRIRTITNTSKFPILVQVKVKFYNFSEQDIYFKLFTDNIQIGSDQQTYKSGVNEVILYGTYQNLISDKVVVDISVSPKSNKQVTITNTTMTIWGDSQTYQEEYEAVETSANYYLSYISNNRLYAKKFDKTKAVEDYEFEFIEEAISHSVCQNNDVIYLFRVDPNGNLFFRTFDNNNEIFISNNVSKVSCCSFGNLIIYNYISNGDCHYGEIKNSVVISNKILTTKLGKFSNCYLYYNSYNNKVYMILTKQDGSNYLLENITENFSSSENISSEISLTIEVQEGESWYFLFTTN